MNTMTKTLLGAALVLFGALASATPSWAAASFECEGRADPVCTVTKQDSCVKTTICGIGLGPQSIPYLLICCSEFEIITEYTYYRS